MPRYETILLTKKGWRLSPMFDVNPNPYGGEGALDMGDLLGDAGYYRFTPAQAKARYDQIAEVVRNGCINK